jgi:hypothetical protein
MRMSQDLCGCLREYLGVQNFMLVPQAVSRSPELYVGNSDSMYVSQNVLRLRGLYIGISECTYMSQTVEESQCVCVS